ncbi:MAG TPA: hypothetical protein VME44_13600 [Streptosporangiaceae bacterium]|nr:hypothetical protein [Streptosporangiaceae bacterium]
MGLSAREHGGSCWQLRRLGGRGLGSPERTSGQGSSGAAAEPAEAKKFYPHLVPEFEQSPTDELHLVLPFKDIRKTLAS